MVISLKWKLNPLDASKMLTFFRNSGYACVYVYNSMYTIYTQKIISLEHYGKNVLLKIMFTTNVAEFGFEFFFIQQFRLKG